MVSTTANYNPEQAITCHALKRASGSVVRVYQYLRNAQLLAAQHKRKWVTPRYQTIADDLGIHVRTVCRAIIGLIERGLIVVQSRFRRMATGQMRQIANRISVAMTTTAVLARNAAIKSRAELIKLRHDMLAKFRSYRSDIPVTPRIANNRSAPYRGSPIYQQLMMNGIKSGSGPKNGS